MVRVYRIPPEKVQHERQRIATAVITLLVVMPVSVGLIAVYFRLDLHSLTIHDIVTPMLMVGAACAVLWLYTLTLSSLQIELDDDRITRTHRLLWGSPLKVSFGRDDVGHIREVGKSGLMIRGRGRKGRYIDLHIPRSAHFTPCGEL